MTGFRVFTILLGPILLLSNAVAEDHLNPYVERFLARFPRIQPTPALIDYASTTRFDGLYMDRALAEQLATGMTNEQGEMAWGWSYQMMAYNTMFRATKSPRYLLAQLRCTRAVLAARDDRHERTLWTGETAPVWGCSAYTGRGRCAFAVHTAMIVYPMLEFLLLARQDDRFSEALGTDGLEIERAALQSLAFHDRQWREGPGAGEGHYVGLNQEPSLEGVPLPANRLAAMGCAHWLAWQVVGDRAHHDRACALGRYLRNRLTVTADDAFRWSYSLPAQPTPNATVEVAEDISHAALTVSLPILLGEAGEVFTVQDLQRLGRTVMACFAQREDGILCGDLACDPQSSPEMVQLPARWLRLCPVVPQLYPRIAAFYLNFVAKPGPLDLALLIRYRAECDAERE